MKIIYYCVQYVFGKLQLKISIPMAVDCIRRQLTSIYFILSYFTNSLNIFDYSIEINILEYISKIIDWHKNVNFFYNIKIIF